MDFAIGRKGKTMDDLIKRQAAIDEANAWLLECLGVTKQNRSCGLIRRLEDLPSAQTGCDGCRYERFGSRKCYVCARSFADRYEVSE